MNNSFSVEGVIVAQNVLKTPQTMKLSFQDTRVYKEKMVSSKPDIRICIKSVTSP